MVIPAYAGALGGKNQRETALITGASSGIGLDLARLMAPDFDLILTARSQAVLEQRSKELEEHGNRVHVVPSDLALPDSPQKLFAEIERRGLVVDVLINNAGFGSYGPFADSDLRSELDMIQVNIAALTHLTKLALPGMLSRKHGRIMNVASTAGFQPGPLMAVYYERACRLLQRHRGCNHHLLTFNAGAGREFSLRRLTEQKRTSPMYRKLLLPPMAIVCLAMALPTASWCGTFTVNPVRIQVSSSRPNAILQITNRDDQSVTLQAHVVSWSFDGQKDVYSDSDDVMLNPPIAIVGGHQTQFIRLGLRHPVEGGEERTYRLIVEEVPPPPKPDFRGVQTILRISIPIFAVPKAAAAPAAKVNWQAVRTNDSRVRLIATNRGNAHVQVKTLEVSSADSPDNYLKGTPPTYLLPTQQREWLIDDKRTLTAKRIKILAVTDAGVAHEIVEIAQ